LVSQQLKREIVIEATPEIVWDAVTEPEQMALWFGDAVEFDLRPGGTGTMTWRPGGRATEQLEEPLTIPLQIEQIDPPRLFSFRWTHPADAEATPHNSLLVEFTLVPEGDATRLRVVESGFAEIERDTESELDGHEEGWRVHLESLRHYVVSRSAKR
jgi:uncharacterized protein YndB with AHSA1/START domain